MIPVSCRTNLDLCHCEKWPIELPALPRVGDYIQSAYGWNTEWREPGSNEVSHIYKNVHLELAVCKVRWGHRKKSFGWGLDITSSKGEDIWIAEIELHLPPHRFENLVQFYEWYGKVCGRGKSAFI